MNTLSIQTELHSIDHQLADALAARLSLDVDLIFFSCSLEPSTSREYLLGDIWGESYPCFELGEGCDITHDGESLMDYLTVWEKRALERRAKSWAEGYEI